MSLNEKTDWNELVGKRVLLENAHGYVYEAKIIEVLQSKKFVKILYNPDVIEWKKVCCDGSNFCLDKLVEVLEDKEKLEKDGRQIRLSNLCKRTKEDMIKKLDVNEKDIHEMSIPEFFNKLAKEKPEGCSMKCDGCVLEYKSGTPALYLLCNLMVSLHDDEHWDSEKKIY